MLLINDLFSADDLYRAFCTPQRSSWGGITIISQETQVPSVFLAPASFRRSERLSTKYFPVHFSVNHCQRKVPKLKCFPSLLFVYRDMHTQTKYFFRSIVLFNALCFLTKCICFRHSPSVSLSFLYFFRDRFP